MDATRTLQLSCNIGKIANLVDWGLTTQIEDPLSCITKPESLCKDFRANLLFDNEFKKNCLNKEFCTLNNLSQFLLPKEKQT